MNRNSINSFKSEMIGKMKRTEKTVNVNAILAREKATETEIV